MATRRTARGGGGKSTMSSAAPRRAAPAGGGGSSPRRNATNGPSPLEIGPEDTTTTGTTNSDDEDPRDDDGGDDIEQQYREERERNKIRHWKESEYAAGLVEPTWSDELDSYRDRGTYCCCCPSGEELSGMFREEIDPGCGCIYLSAVCCSRIGAGRVGNMAVLRERYVTVEEEADEEGGSERADGFVDDNDDGEAPNPGSKKTRLVRRRELQLVVGPFWPMLIFITYPLIFGVSGLTLWKAIPRMPFYVQIIWAALTLQLIRSLFNTGFRDPGILRRHRDPPPVPDDLNDELTTRRVLFRPRQEGPWRWSDQAQSYRPRSAMFDPDTRVIVEEFDHT